MGIYAVCGWAVNASASVIPGIPVVMTRYQNNKEQDKPKIHTKKLTY